MSGFQKLKLLLFVLAAAFLCARLPGTVPADGKKILFLSSYELSRSWSQNVLRGYISTLSVSKIPYDLNMVTLTELLNRKKQLQTDLKSGRFDILVVLDNPGIHFLLKILHTLPDSLNIVCLPDETLQKFNFSQRGNVTGISRKSEIGQNIQLGMKLFPKAKRIILLSGATPFEPVIRKEFNAITGSLNNVVGDFISGAQVSTVAMMAHVRKNQKNSILIYHNWSSSMDYSEFPLQWIVLTNLTADSSIPIFVMKRCLTGYGTLGGWVDEGKQLGAESAEQTIPILSGRQAKLIPWKTLASVPYFDSAVLRKHCVDERDLPPGSIVSGRVLSFRKELREKYLVLLAAFLLTALALCGLTVYHIIVHRRRERDVALLNLLPVTFGVMDKDHEILLHHDYLHYMKMMYVGNNKFLLEKMPENYKKQILAFFLNVDSVIDSRVPHSSEYTVNGKHYRCRIFPLPAGLFARPSAIWITEDIDDLCRKNRMSMESATRLTQTLFAIGDGLIVTDVNEIVTMINPEGEKLTGFSASEAVGKHLSEIFRIVQTERKMEGSPVWQALFLKKTVISESSLELIAKDGVHRSISSTVSPIIPESNIPAGAVLVFRDITKESRDRRQIHFDNILLKQAATIGRIDYFQYDPGKKEFISLSDSKIWPVPFDGSLENIHKWVSPQDAGKLFSDWQDLLNRRIDELDTEYHAGMHGEMNMYRMKVIPEFDANGIPFIYSGIIQNMTYNNRLELEHLRMLENERLLCRALCDFSNEFDSEKRIRHFMNYLLQAAGGSRCSVFAFCGNCLSADCVFERTRSGIPGYPEQNPRMDFSRFPEVAEKIRNDSFVVIHADQTANRENFCHFLNLSGTKSAYLSRIVVRNHVWGYLEIDYVSEKHAFSQSDIAIFNTAAAVCSLLLEQHREIHSPEKEIEHPSVESGADAGQNRVLVVDDIELNLKLLSAMLRRIKVNVVTANSAPSAVEIAKNGNVSLILTDVWMPNITGEELAEQLAADPQTSSIPVVAITADTQVKPGHFAAVLHKPVRFDHLSEIVRKYCNLPG